MSRVLDELGDWDCGSSVPSALHVSLVEMTKVDPDSGFYSSVFSMPLLDMEADLDAINGKVSNIKVTGK